MNLKDLKKTALASACLFLGACSSLSHKSSGESVDAGRLQTPSQAEQARRFLLNQQLGSRTSTDPAGTAEETEATDGVALDDIPPCKGNRFPLKDLVLDELSLSNLDAREVAATLAVMGYTIVDPAALQNANADQPTSGFNEPSPAYSGWPSPAFSDNPGQAGYSSPVAPGFDDYASPPVSSYADYSMPSETVSHTPAAAAGAVAQRYACEQLPVIVMPTLADDSVFMFQEKKARQGLASSYDSSAYGSSSYESSSYDYSSYDTSSYGSSSGYGTQGVGATGSLIINPLRRSNSANIDRLLVFYHPEKKTDRDRLYSLVRKRIDSAATQVYIESMVIEVSKEDSKELGVEWQSANIGGNSLLTLGQLDYKASDTVGFERNTRTDSFGNYLFDPGAGVRFKLRALIESGRAQVLSRPSVLALSNRQAVIQILDVIQSPRVSSRINENGSLTISDYAFDPFLVGITLNLRPRVSSDRQWVSMEIDATVEAEVDENAGEIFAPDPAGGRVLLASKEGAASRKVRTFARIPDRTPIIIGGLAAANRENTKGRVPGVGELPLIGGLFGSTNNEIQERELIIVLTPYVLAEDAIGIRHNAADRSHLLKVQ